MAILTPGDALVAVLRASAISKFDWTDGPWYKQAAEPQPAFPFIVFDLKVKPFGSDPNSDSLWTFEKTFQSGYDATITIHALQPDIAVVASEYGSPSQSIFAYLDKFIENPNGMTQDPTVFVINKWLRQGPVDFDLSEFRSPGTPRVWKAEATYTMCVLADTN